MASSSILFHNTVLNSAFIAWAIAQITKVIISIFKDKKIDVTRFTGAGGMPSSHSSTMLAMTTSVGLASGFQSVEFAIALVMSFVVMYDATGVRRAAGEQAKTINYIMNNWNSTTPKEFTKELKELLGHTPFEVLVGAILGIAVGYLTVGL